MRIIAAGTQLCLRPDKCLLARLEGVEIVRAACARVDPGYRSQPDTIDPPSVIVHTRKAGLLRSINPQRQAAVIRSRAGRRLPVQFDEVRHIVESEPARVGPARAVISQRCPELIVTVAEAELNSQHQRG